MRHPWANVALLVLLVAQLATGFLGLINGADSWRWILWLHSAGAYAVVVVLGWKGAIIWDVFFRRRLPLTVSRLAFLVLAAIVTLILATGFLWTYTGPSYVLVFSLMTVHALLAILLIALLVWHTLARWFIWRIPRARNRRAFLRLAGASVVGMLAWAATTPLKSVLALPGANRRFTGSYETGSLTGLFPEVSWLFDDPLPIERTAWRLVVEGLVDQPIHLRYEELAGLPQRTVTATIDCTGGWYSTQDWTGIELGQLLDRAGVHPSARSLTVESVSGYSRRFALAEARQFLLATEVAGQPLNHAHGFPVRLVAPGYRGFQWVKWVTRITVQETSELLQPPVPLQ